MSDWLAELARGPLIGIALGLVAVEAVALGLFYARYRRGLSWVDAVPNLASGALLMCACRAALTGRAETVPLWLGASLVAHVVDLGRRWGR